MAVILSDITRVRNSNLKFITSGELYMINYLSFEDQKSIIGFFAVKLERNCNFILCVKWEDCKTSLASVFWKNCPNLFFLENLWNGILH